MADVRANLARYRARIARRRRAVAGGRAARPTAAMRRSRPHGLTGSDEAGSGGDD